MKSRRPRRIASPLAIPAWIALCSQLVVLVHLWLVPHTRCAEHGETVHDQTETRVAHAERSSLSADPAAPSAAEDDHDHCQLATDRRAVTVEQFTTVVDQPVISDVRPLVARVEIGRALYRLAPKVSPPPSLT